ncbi:hypothetical protein [Streptomyces kronopolitis]|uniref:hypothetical protein n=1 Tax=Streptomyces kronopolitis TaxID=1612435 RepID=UPI0034351EAB
MAERLSVQIDAENDAFTNAVKSQLLQNLPEIDTAALEWLVMEHYQFSFANKELLQKAVDCTKKLADTGVSTELQRNVDEEDGHAPMYKKGMLQAGTDMDKRAEFPRRPVSWRMSTPCAPPTPHARWARSTPPRPPRSSSTRCSTRSARRSATAAGSPTRAA